MMMGAIENKIDKILLVVKRSFLEEKSASPELSISLRSPYVPPEINQQIGISHNEHQSSIQQICDVLKEIKVDFDLIYRDKLSEVSISALNQYQLVVTIGGDGTVLTTAPYFKTTPMVGVNSSTTYSVGRLCMANKHSFKEIINKIINQKLSMVQLQRLSVVINETPVDDLALNEILLSHPHPAAVSMYQLTCGRSSEIQKSSGVWIATAAGSTAAIRSAGGQTSNIDNKEIQYLVRESVVSPLVNCQLKHGFIPYGDRITFVSLMKKGILSFDGIDRCYSFNFGDKISIFNNKYPLNLFIN